MALALTPNLIWMIQTTVFESCCTEYGNKWQHVPASWLFCSVSPHLGWDCVWDGLCGRTTAKILGQRQQETAGKMTQELSHFQKKHESTFLDNKKNRDRISKTELQISQPFYIHNYSCIGWSILCYGCALMFMFKICIYSMSAGSFPSLPPHFPLGATGVQEP